MKIGIIQGRLSEPVEGYQETPQNWKKEFSDIETLGMSHVEWVVTKNNLFENPICKESMHNYKISSICLDHVIDERIFQKDFFVNNVYYFCKIAEDNQIQSITLPIMENSKVDSKKKKDILKDLLFECCESFKNLEINIEAEIDPVILYDITKPHERLKITYDTGNITALNFNHEVYIRKNFNKISNVHLKDRKRNYGKSCMFGKGDTDFESIFKTLSSLGYGGLYTLQMARSATGNEYNHIRELNLKFRRIHDKYF